MTNAPIRIELAEWIQRMPIRTRRQVRRHALAGCAVGLVLVGLAVVGLVILLVVRGLSAEVVGPVMVGGLGVLLCVNGRRQLGWVPREEPDRPVQFAAPYAFELGESEIRFPAYAGKSAEVWPLAQTVVEVTGRGSAARLRLTCPGHRTRRYPARSLAEPPAAIAALLKSQVG